MEGSGSESIPIITAPAPGGPKAYESYRSWSWSTTIFKTRADDTDMSRIITFVAKSEIKTFWQCVYGSGSAALSKTGRSSNAGMRDNYLLKPVFRIPDVHHGSRIRTFLSRCPNPGSKKKAPDPGSGSATKNLSIVIPKNWNYALENNIRDIYSASWFPYLDFFHPGSNG